MKFQLQILTRSHNFNINWINGVQILHNFRKEISQRVVEIHLEIADSESVQHGNVESAAHSQQKTLSHPARQHIPFNVPAGSAGASRSQIIRPLPFCQPAGRAGPSRSKMIPDRVRTVPKRPLQEDLQSPMDCDSNPDTNVFQKRNVQQIFWRIFIKQLVSPGTKHEYPIQINPSAKISELKVCIKNVLEYKINSHLRLKSVRWYPPKIA